MRYLHCYVPADGRGLAPRLFLLACLLMSTLSASSDEPVFEIPRDAFLRDSFQGQIPEPRVLWLTGKLKDEVRNLLGHNYPSLRIRYWHVGTRYAWILEEIGKERPITAGFVIDNGRMSTVKVLAFRESRGGEIRFDTFTHQFNDARLDASGQLDRNIDGISGATLSVNAMRKLGTLALLLTRHVETVTKNK